MIGVIRGTGSYAPKKVMTNDDLSTIVETSDEWIRERTGIERRHIADGERTSDMAIEAAKDALASAKMSPEELDLVIVATTSPDKVMPNIACVVQSAIGASHAVCFDMNAACSGFLFAYHTAQMYIAGGSSKRALVIGADSISTLLDWSDRGTCVLFGDGAGAAVLEATKGEPSIMVGGSNGDKGKALVCESRHQTKVELEDTYLKMDGQEVFKFVLREIPKCINGVLEQVKVEKDEIDLYIVHQANKRIIDSVAKKLGVSTEKLPVNLMEYGNTSAASVPLLLDELNKSGKLKPGMKLILSGFGAGLTWGATYVEWQ